MGAGGAGGGGGGHVLPPAAVDATEGFAARHIDFPDEPAPAAPSPEIDWDNLDPNTYEPSDGELAEALNVLGRTRSLVVDSHDPACRLFGGAEIK